MKRMLLTILFLTSIIAVPVNSFATVSSTTSKVIYTGDGTSSSFSFSFNIYKTSDLVIQKVLISTGVSTTLTLNSDYTVTLTHAVPTPGSITLTAGALATTYKLVILRSLPLTQLINITDPYYTTPAATWNEAHDRATMLAQQLQEQLSRGLLGPTTSSTQITLPTGVAGLCLGWDGTGTALSNLTCSGGGGGGTGFNPPIDDSQLQAITTASKVNGSAIYSIASLPSGAGMVPVANLPVGTSASNIVQLNGSAQLPAVSGVNVTNISGANFVSLSSIPSGAGLIPSANLPTLTTVWVPNNIQVFSTSGTATWTKPANVSTVYVKAWGAGASGGGASANASCGSGGGGGGYSEGAIAVTGNVTVTVGAKGAAGSVGANDGNDGGLSSFAGTTTLTANGGSKGIKSGTATAAAGGSASNGSINLTGYTSQAGISGSAQAGKPYGAGGASFSFPGAYASTPDIDTTGLNAQGVGAGGAGGCRASSSTAGGAGADGMVIVYY